MYRKKNIYLVYTEFFFKYMIKHHDRLLCQTQQMTVQLSNERIKLVRR